MGELEPDSELMRYFEAQYWDGHSMGDGTYNSMHGIDTVPDGLFPQVKEEAKHARLLLKSGIEVLRNTPARIYRPGDTFEVEGSNEGAIIIFDRESLITPTDGVLSKSYRRKIEETPTPPGALDELDWRADYDTRGRILHDDILYGRDFRIGVTATMTVGDGTMHKTILSGNHISMRNDCINYNPYTLHWWPGYVTQVEIGKIYHEEPLRPDGREQMVRTNRLEYYLPGAKKRVKAMDRLKVAVGNLLDLKPILRPGVED